MAFTALLLAGCTTETERDWGVELVDPTLVWTDEGYSLIAGVELEPSPAMLEALERGVSLTLAIQTRATRGRLWIPGLDRIRKHRLEISYLPLSRHYQLVYHRDDTQTVYPRLSMLISDLTGPEEWSIKIEDGDLERGPWRVQARVELDQSRLPSPMRLPAWFDSQWRLRSQWQEWTTQGVRPDDG